MFERKYMTYNRQYTMFKRKYMIYNRQQTKKQQILETDNGRQNSRQWTTKKGQRTSDIPSNRKQIEDNRRKTIDKGNRPQGFKLGQLSHPLTRAARPVGCRRLKNRRCPDTVLERQLLRAPFLLASIEETREVEVVTT